MKEPAGGQTQKKRVKRGWRVWTGGDEVERGFVLGPVWPLLEVLLPATWDQPGATMTGNFGLEDG